MKKTFIITTAIILLTTSVAFSQTKSRSSKEESSFSKGDNIVDLGVGFSAYGVPLHAAFEHMFTDDVSAGVFGNFATYRSVSAFWAGVKGNYHFNRLLALNTDKADIFAGASLGYWSVGSKGFNYGYGNSAFFVIQVGGRYYFTEKLGAYAEFGGGNLSGGTVGITFKL
jgi:hypothetical protein